MPQHHERIRAFHAPAQRCLRLGPLAIAHSGVQRPDRPGAMIVLGSCGKSTQTVGPDQADAGARVFHVYEYALKGFAFRGSTVAARTIERTPRVVFVAPDQVVELVAQTLPTGINRIDV